MTEMSELLKFKLIKVYAEGEFEYNAITYRLSHDFYDLASALRIERPLDIVITSEHLTFVIPSGQPLTAFEKFLSPFDHTTWWLTLITLGVTFSGIQIVSFVSRQLRDLCFGEKIGSPTMNFLNVFLSGGQTKVPKGISARLIFVNFMIWSLIVRTCFQSLNYRALQLDLRHPPMKTVDDLRENNFKQLALTSDFNSVTAEDLHNFFYE